MLDTNPKAKSRSSPLHEWIHKTIGGEGLRLKVRLNSHKLHIICEGKNLPESSSIANQLKKAIPSALPLLQQESVECINVYGLLLGQDHPRWSETLLINFPARATLGLDEINQLDSIDHLNQFESLNHPKSTPAISQKSAQKSSPKSNPELSQSLINLTPDNYPTSRANHISRTLTPHQTSSQIPSLTAIAEALHPFVKPFGVTVKVEEVTPKSSSDFSPLVLFKLANKLSDLPTTSLGNQQVHSSEVNQVSNLISNQANLQGADSHPKLRVNCYCEYSLAPERIVPLLIQQLRRLNLSSYRDVLLSGYLEEKNKPLWAVKGNLTADQQLLREWAKWGDRAALVELLNNTLAQSGIRFRSIPKEGTLHLFCSTLGSTPPDQSLVMGAIVPLLEELAPHNLQAFAIYGTQQTNLAPDSPQDFSQTSQVNSFPDSPNETPVWIQWINIASAQSVHNVRELAQQGNAAALEFLLKQAVNPDIQTYLATGGIEVMIRQREDLLDVVTETPLGPSQKSVVKPIVRCVSSLQLPNIAGVRIYGRPSGKSRPDWKYGKDFRDRSRSSPAPKKSPPLGTNAPRTTTPASVGINKEPDKPSIPSLLQPLRDILGRSGILIEADEPELRELEPKAVAVWAVLGLMLMLQTDWLLGAVSKRLFPPVANNSTGQTRIQSDPANPNSLSSLPPGQSSIDPNLAPENTEAFNNSGFTGDGGNVVVIDQANNQVKSARIAQATALLAATDKENPSFNSSLLNEKLLLYQERIREKGHPPDVLIVGSSRALRGIDPLVLKQSLAAQGYPEVDIFNFGINGATAKFVDFLVRRMLAPEQLPKLIIWADGARAFNGNRQDLTYDALLHTDGYRQVVAGTFPGSVELSGTASRSPSFLKTMRKFTYPEGNDSLQQLLSSLSQSYTYRQELFQLTQRTLGTILPAIHNSPEAELRPLESQHNESAIDIDGFLALEERFQPEVYYQKYAKVPGDYDKDYEAFNLEGKQDAALGELMQYLQSRQVKLVFVNLPLTDLYLDPVRMKYEGQFESYLRDRANQYQFIVRNLNTTWLNQYPYFSDPSHLNRYGAESLSRILAEDPVIPWQGN